MPCKLVGVAGELSASSKDFVRFRFAVCGWFMVDVVGGVWARGEERG